MTRNGKGLEFTAQNCITLGKKVRLFRDRHDVIIQGNYVEYVRELIIRGKKEVVKVRRKPLVEVYDQISQVYDHSNVCIARRLNPNHALLSTGKGAGKQFLPVTELEVYHAI